MTTVRKSTIVMSRRKSSKTMMTVRRRSQGCRPEWPPKPTMSLPTSPNRTTPTSIRQGDLGWPVFAVQGGLDELGLYCMADGVFGPATYRMIQAFQRKIQSLTIDGIAGPATQAQITRLIDVRIHTSHPSLPAGLLRGSALSES